MVQITSDNIIRIMNGDIIVKGDPDEIKKSKYEDGWYVSGNFRDLQELEVEKSGLLELPASINIKSKLPYDNFTDGNWYRLNV